MTFWLQEKSVYNTFTEIVKINALFIFCILALASVSVESRETLGSNDLLEESNPYNPVETSDYDVAAASALRKSPLHNPFESSALFYGIYESDPLLGTYGVDRGAYGIYGDNAAHHGEGYGGYGGYGFGKRGYGIYAANEANGQEYGGYGVNGARKKGYGTLAQNGGVGTGTGSGTATAFRAARDARAGFP